MNRSADKGSPLKYVRMRAPETNGSTFHHPAATSIGTTWTRNLQATDAWLGLTSVDFRTLRELGRSELLLAARQFTSTQICANINPAYPNRIILAGHQPTLFHPGVWYKNFVLSNLGQRFDCHAVNLIIDNDVCESSSVRVPVQADEQWQLIDMAYDDQDSIVPFEERNLVSSRTFDTFATRLSTALQPLIPDPLINRLWPLVAKDSTTGNPHLAVARGRHALEHQHGLKTLEIPISQITKFRSFAWFFREIIARLDEFIEIHNRLLLQYRQVNRIRSRVHPVPSLARDDDWLETPFWIWQRKQPVRHSLFCRPTESGWCLSDRQEWQTTIPDSQFSQTFRALQQGDVRIRPRALMTTLFSRLLLSDLFIHGIGGARYDQLTNELARQFLGVTLPSYLTVTATMKISRDQDSQLESQWKLTEEQLREMKFHPEKFTDPGDQQAASWIARKQQWTGRPLPPTGRKQQHQEIERCNRQLHTLIQARKLQLLEQRELLAAQRTTNRILSSREFSICLYPESLPQELVELARPWAM